MKNYRENTQGLPEEIKKLVLSSGIYQKIESIAEKHNLHIDQIGELASETRKVLMGVTRSKDFIDRIIFAAEIDRGVAEEIANEINAQIFQSIRAALQKVQEETEPDLDATSEPPIEPETDRGPMNREEILNGIENPQMASTRPINVLEQSHKNGDDMVDHMLTGTVSQPIVTETRTEKYSTDPYREAIN